MKTEGNTTTPNDRTVLWATAHRPQKPSSQWNPGRSCTNIQTGPLRVGLVKRAAAICTKTAWADIHDLAHSVDRKLVAVFFSECKSHLRLFAKTTWPFLICPSPCAETGSLSEARSSGAPNQTGLLASQDCADPAVSSGSALKTPHPSHSPAKRTA